MSTRPFSICALHTSPHLQVPFTAWSPDIRHHAKRKYKPRPRLPEEHAEPPEGRVATSPQASVVDGRQARPAVCGGRGRGALDVREAARPAPPQGMWRARWWCPCRPATSWATPTPTPPWTDHPSRQVAGCGLDPVGAAWPDGRQRHLSAVWDMVLESRAVQGTFRISFPCPIVVRGGGNLPAGQELVGMFAHRLVRGHWRVQTGVSQIGEEGTVTTAGVFGLNVLTGWEQRGPEWADVAWLAMRVHVGR